MIEKIGFRTRLKLDYEQAVQAARAALQEEGFGVLTEIDVKATLKAKLDKDFRRYVILGPATLLWLTGPWIRIPPWGCSYPATS